MRKNLSILLILVVLVGVVGCKTTAKSTAATATGVKYATGFTMEKVANGCTKITDGEKQTILLVPAGKKAPAGYETAVQIAIPVKRVVIMASTFGALMRPLGVLDTVVGSGTNVDEFYIDEMKAGYANGQIKYVGGGAMGAPDFEAIAVLNPDVVFCSTGYPDAVTYYEKMKSLGLKVVVINDYMETDPLARLEWMKVIAAFYGKDAVAKTYFASVEKKIADIEAKVAGVSTRPNVLWGSIFGGSVYVSGGDSYVAKWIDQTGGNYVFKDIQGSGSATINLEELYSKGTTADVFIYASTPPYINSIKEIIDNNPALLSKLALLQYGKVYCMQPWYFQISDKPDEIVADLAYIFHPDLFPGYKLQHFMLLPAQ